MGKHKVLHDFTLIKLCYLLPLIGAVLFFLVILRPYFTTVGCREGEICELIFFLFYLAHIHVITIFHALYTIGIETPSYVPGMTLVLLLGLGYNFLIGLSFDTFFVLVRNALSSIKR